MDFLNTTSDLTSKMYKILMKLSYRGVSHDGIAQHDAMKVLMLLSGIIVETALVFDKPDEAAHATLETISKHLGTPPNAGRLGHKALPPSAMIDQEIEKGRTLGRQIFEEWLDCSFEFHHRLTCLTADIIRTWEDSGHRRADMLRLLSECVYRGMAFEIAAQELCDMMVEKHVGCEYWTLGESISALSAVAGLKLANSEQACRFFGTYTAIEDLDCLIYTMTQEAVRLGVPAGSDWRFGLAANDVPVSAPYDLIEMLLPVCDDFFNTIKMHNDEDQAVACAKAAGRMLAVTAGGDIPEIEPVIAKPLALAAITDTYKSVCMERLSYAK